MSILRHFNKHHGWYGGARTPYGGPELVAGEIALEALAPEVTATVAPEFIGAGAYEAGLAGTAGEGSLYGAGMYGAGEGATYGAGMYGAGEGAAYAGSELAAEQATQEAARQAAIQNAGQTQLTNIPADQMGSYSGLQTELNAMANNPAYSNVVADAANSTVSNAPVDSAIGSGGGTFGINAAPTAGTYGLTGSQAPNLTAGLGATMPPVTTSLIPGVSNTTLGMGAAGLGLNSLMSADRNKYGVPAAEKYSGPLSKFKYDPNTYQYTAPVNRQYTPNYSGYARTGYAEGGITDIDQSYAKGGIAGLLKGRGDGMSDSIRATIADKQPARLADGEFVVPADVVSHLGNGSTDAGAKHLYKMMDKVRHARTGSKKQGKQIAAGGYLPIK
jgi:hypothetical protein